jgi:hypothetical protein
MALHTRKKSVRRNGGSQVYQKQMTSNTSKTLFLNKKNIAIIEPYTKDSYLTADQKTQLEVSLLKHFGVENWFELQMQVEDAVASISPLLHSTCKNKKNTTKVLNKKNMNWKKCSDTCEKTIHSLIKKELSSTAYMIRTFSKSILTADHSSNPISFTLPSSLTGVWVNDSSKIAMKITNPSDINRLIMGFGPSAAGKTYWAKTIINLFSSSDPDFPKTFISIDGGIARETSMIYQMVINAIKKTCIAGFDNLILAGAKIISSSLFGSGDVKKAMTAYLNENLKNKCSLYVPDTLGNCFTKTASQCKTENYQSYIEITGNSKWIGLLIWQHETGAECDKKSNFKCKGCTESGQARQINEGKKYNSSAYGTSMRNGKTQMMMAPGGRFNIHNTGGAVREVNGKKQFNTSIIEDFSDINNALSETLALEDNQTNNNYKYMKAT